MTRHLSHHVSKSFAGSDLWRCFRKKVYINKNNFHYISPICPEATRGQICTKFGTAVDVANVIIYDKFFRNRLRGVDSVKGQNLPFSIDKASRH